MKKLYTIFLLSISLSISAQLEGTWKLLPAAGSMGCGDAGQGAMNWWSNSAADTSVRACIFDDSITFSAGGSYMQYMDGSTWLENWQGSEVLLLTIHFVYFICKTMCYYCQLCKLHASQH